MKLFRAASLYCLIVISVCGCATTQQSSYSFPSNSMVKQDKPDVWQQWAVGVLSFIGGGAYQSAADSMDKQHP
jgi:hypothetical protein